MIYAREGLTPETAVDIEELVTGYYASTNAHVGLPPYSFDWALYGQLERLGQLALFTARDDGGLVGVAMYIMSDHPHHKNLYSAMCDTIAVTKVSRGRGIGKSLYLFAESTLIELGVKQIVHHYRTVYDESPLFPKLGFKLVEHVYAKEVG